VTRVTLEVGSQGKLGGQAHVPDVEGVWFELVRNVSFLFCVYCDAALLVYARLTLLARLTECVRALRTKSGLLLL
jgi:osomolarity two-component system sensor histidine kinase NIK1